MLPRRALISVHDTTELEDLVQRLLSLGVEVVASTRNAQFLREKDVFVRTIGELVGGGAVPTQLEAFDARIFAGIMASEDELPALASFGGHPIDLVVVNLARVEKNANTLDEVLSKAELERPALIRAAAINHARVVVLVRPEDYGRVMKRLIDYDDVPLETRRELAIRALGLLARHEAALGRAASSFDREGAPRATPELLTVVATQASELRAPPRSLQVATFYAEENAPRGSLPTALMYGSGDAALPTAMQLRSSEQALELIAELTSPAVALFSRGRPVVVVVAETVNAAVIQVLRAMPKGLSAPLVVSNQQVDPASAQLLAQAPLETLVAPSVHVDALDVLQAKSDLCIVVTRELPSPTRAGLDLTVVRAGLVAETHDATAAGEVIRGEVVTTRRPTEKELRALELAWKVAKHAPSDAIVRAREDDDGTLRTIGIAASATSRRSAIREALALAAEAATGAVLASDAPVDQLADLNVILDAGILAVAHPGSAADAANVAGSTHVLTMVATGVSHLKA